MLLLLPVAFEAEKYRQNTIQQNTTYEVGHNAEQLSYVVRVDDELDGFDANLERHFVARARRNHQQGLVVPRSQHHVLDQLDKFCACVSQGEHSHGKTLKKCVSTLCMCATLVG